MWKVTVPYRNSLLILMIGFLLGACATSTTGKSPDPLPSWNDGPLKSNIVEFVTDVTRQDSDNYVKPPERIAVFDNDGTLWAEKPVYFQIYFILDRSSVWHTSGTGSRDQYGTRV